MKTKTFLIASIIATSGLLAGCNLADEPKNNIVDGFNTTTEVKQAVSEDIAIEFPDDEEDNSIEVIHLDDEEDNSIEVIHLDDEEDNSIEVIHLDDEIAID